MKVNLKKESRELGKLGIKLGTMIGVALVSFCQLTLQVALLFFTIWSVVFLVGNRIGRRWQQRVSSNRRIPTLLDAPAHAEGGRHGK